MCLTQVVERQVNELDLIGCNEDTPMDDVNDMVWGFRIALSDTGNLYDRKVFCANLHIEFTEFWLSIWA